VLIHVCFYGHGLLLNKQYDLTFDFDIMTSKYWSSISKLPMIWSSTSGYWTTWTTDYWWSRKELSSRTRGNYYRRLLLISQ